MALLLSYSQQQAIRPISSNNESKYAQMAAEVESLEVDKLLGSAFYQDVVDNPDEYADLLGEYEFTRADQTTIKHRGLRYVIAYLNYSKYIGESYITDSFSGMVQKLRPDSEHISSGDIKRLQQQYREIAFNAFNLIREFLDLNKDTYTLWDCNSDKKMRRPNFYSLKNTET